MTYDSYGGASKSYGSSSGGYGQNTGGFSKSGGGGGGKFPSHRLYKKATAETNLTAANHLAVKVLEDTAVDTEAKQVAVTV